MVIHSLRDGKNGDRLDKILNMKTKDEKLIREAIEII
jgi:hypothetical protein